LGYPVPTTPLKQMGADKVIAVHLSAHWVRSRGPRHVFEVIGQCFSIAQDKMRGAWEANADVILEPAVGDFSYDSFARSADIIRIGEEAMRQALPTVQSWFRQGKLPAHENMEAAAAKPAPEPIVPPIASPLPFPAK
jgi:hypothetical protein